jgi:hypothetical protein
MLLVSKHIHDTLYLVKRYNIRCIRASQRTVQLYNLMKENRSLFRDDFLLDLLFEPGNATDVFLRNVGSRSQECIAL